MTNSIMQMLQGYLALSQVERIDFIKQVSKLERMPLVEKADHENMINSLKTNSGAQQPEHIWIAPWRAELLKL